MSEHVNQPQIQAETDALAVDVERQLGQIKELTGAQVCIRQTGEPWREVARFGHLDVEQTEADLMHFDPEAGGAVAPIKDQEGSDWRASYSCAGAVLDIFVVAFIAGRDPGAVQKILVRLEQRIGWLVVALEKTEVSETQIAGLPDALSSDILIEAALAKNKGQLADQWIAQLENGYGPDMVSVCWVDGYHPKLAHVSGGARVTQNSDKREALETLAREAIEAREPVFRSSEDSLMERHFQTLQSSRSLSIPVYQGDPCRAVVTLIAGPNELHQDRDLPGGHTAELLSKLLGHALKVQHVAHPSILRKLRNWALGVLYVIFGKRAAKLKLSLAVIAAAVFIASFVPSQHYPAFSARIEARDRVVIAAPFEGFLSEVSVDLGDHVSAGDTVLQMDDADQRLELSSLAAKRAQIEAALLVARGERNTANVRNLEARLKEIEAETRLIEAQVSKASVIADRAGLVVAGEAPKRVGSRVRLGDMLLQIATTDSLATMALIDESWVSDLPENAQGELLLAAFPEQPISVTLQRITAQTEVDEGTNSFIAWLDHEIPPEVTAMDGMRGVVRLEGGYTTLLGRYGRGIARWARQIFWQWS